MPYRIIDTCNPQAAHGNTTKSWLDIALEEQARAEARPHASSPTAVLGGEALEGMAHTELDTSSKAELDKVARRNLARFQAVAEKKNEAEEDVVEALCYD